MFVRPVLRLVRTMPATRKASTAKELSTETVTAKRQRTKEVDLGEAKAESVSPPLVKAAPTKRKKAVANSDSPSAPRSSDTLADESLPKNVEMPATLSFAPPSAPHQIRMSAWNITSLKSSEPKGLMRYIEAEDADLVILSETKVNDVPMHPALTKLYKHQYWGIGKTKGYAGLAILTKLAPLKATYGLPGLSDQDTKGRIITLEFDNTFVVGTYCVNAGEGLKSMATKVAWNTAFAAHLAELDAQKPVVWCGDLNVVQDERDLSAASKKWNKSPGYTAQECDDHTRLLASTSLVDVWRHLHPTAVGHYTFYGWRGFCRSKGIGWRLDSFIVSQRLVDKVDQCEIRHECYGASDHVPIICDITGPL